MTYPNTFIFTDLASDHPSATAEFYEAVMGWEIEPRPKDVFHRVVPGQNFQLDDGTQGPTGNLHLGIRNVANPRPYPAEHAPPQELHHGGGTVRIWILVSDDDSWERIMEEAAARGATTLWTKHYWAEFNGFNCAFRDPWGNTIVLWIKAGDELEIPDGWTDE